MFAERYIGRRILCNRCYRLSMTESQYLTFVYLNAAHCHSGFHIGQDVASAAPAYNEVHGTPPNDLDTLKRTVEAKKQVRYQPCY